jgi:hypothetical protein
MKIFSKVKSFCSNVVHGSRAPVVNTSSETSLNDSVKQSHQRKPHGKVYRAFDCIRKPFRKQHIPHLFDSTKHIPQFDANPISLTNTEIGPISFGSWDLEDFVRTYEVEVQDLTSNGEERSAHVPTPGASAVPITAKSMTPSLTSSSSIHTSENSGVSAASSISSAKTTLTDIELPPDNLVFTSAAVEDCTRDHHISPVVLVKQDRYLPAKLSAATTITVISSSNKSIFSNKGSGGSSGSSDVCTEGRKDMDVDDDNESTTQDNAYVDEEQDISIDSSAKADSKASSDTGSDEESQAPLDRQEWGLVRQIPNSQFILLLQSLLQGLLSSTCIVSDCRVVARFGGGFNHIVAMAVKEGGQIVRYMVRVPAIGTASRWQEGDAHNMRGEMALLKYLRQHTKIPVPEVLAFADNLDTIIGAPFCLMKQLPGKPAHNVWFEGNKVRNHITANCVSPKTEAKRQNLLRTLAQAMAELQTLSFNKIGAPDLTIPPSPAGLLSVTHSYRWTNPHDMEAEDLETSAQIYQYGPSESSKEYMTSTIETAWPTTHPDLDDDPETRNILFGIRKVLDIVYDQEPLDHSSTGDTTYEDETFVLRHPDLEFQNILVDDDGNVTGIIDWEGCLAVPRCVGYASVPDFLRRDWLKGTSLREQPYMCWTLQHYRQIYANAMRATGTPDAKYTAKSAMYRAVVDAVSSGAPMDLIVKLFRQIPGLQTVDVEEFEELLGAGWTKAEQFLEMEMRRLFEPEED